MSEKFQQLALNYQRVEQAIIFLEKNFHRQPTLKEIADSVYVSEYHFQRLFSSWVGISPKRFLQYLTKEYAKSLLKESKNVLDVSFDTGLSSPGRLHDLFVNCEAVTPGEFKDRGDGLCIEYGIHPSPFGDTLLATTARGICCLSFVKKEGVEKEAAGLGIDGYILKPVTARDLIQKMQHVEKQIAPVLVEPIKITNELGLDLRAYEQLLRVLVEDAKKRLKDIGGQVEAGDFKAFHVFTRDLSSSAENLGANALHRAALEASAFVPNSEKKVQEKYFFKIGSEIERVSREISNI